MKIKCCFNKLADIKNKDIRKQLQVDEYLYDNENGVIERFVLGKEYYVYAMTVKDLPSYYIIEDDNDDEDYSIPMCSLFYEIIDPRVSKYWELGVYIDDSGISHYGFMFKEMQEEPYFYERLVDGEEREVAIFKKYKKLIDEEYKN